MKYHYCGALEIMKRTDANRATHPSAERVCGTISPRANPRFENTASVDLAVSLVELVVL